MNIVRSVGKQGRGARRMVAGWCGLGFFGLLLTAGCGGGDGSGDAATPTVQDPADPSVLSGVFIDSPVAGLGYRTANRSGMTDAEGRFFYLPGEQVVFYLGDLELGRVSGADVVTPVELVPGAVDENDPGVTNRCRLLQTLDRDGNPDNGIDLSPEVQAAFTGRSVALDVPVDQFADQPALQQALNDLSGRTVFAQGVRTLRSVEDARAHLRKVLLSRDADRDGFTRGQGDCNDRRADMFPGAAEVCGDGIDQDCDGADPLCDPGQLTTWYLDDDGDGYSDGTAVETASWPGRGYFAAGELTATTGDCADNDPDRHPAATELCGDGIDQDCNGIDPACPPPLASTWYKDADLDGYSDGTTVAATTPPADYFAADELSATAGDCSDSDATRHPGAAELCGDGIDQDCDGVDPICPTAESAYESQLRELIDDYRTQQSLGPLAFDPQLYQLATEHSSAMNNAGGLSHDGFTDRFNRSGYRTCVENVGWNYQTAEAQFTGWKNSSGHNQNLLNSRLGYVGIAKSGAYVTFFACGK